MNKPEETIILNHIFNHEGKKLNPEAYSTCEYCEQKYKIKEMYKAGRVCEDCYDDYLEE